GRGVGSSSAGPLLRSERCYRWAMAPAAMRESAPMVDLYADMFELAPVSLWLEDYSALKSLFERWRAEGVRDLRAHLREDRARIVECSRCLQVLRVNRRTLQLYGAQSQDELVANLPEVFRDDMFEQLVEELNALWSGRLG